MLEWTGERYLPWMQLGHIHYEHLHRYAYVAQLVKGKWVLDLACGEGYGSYILAKQAEYVVGVDIDEQTMHHARSKYPKSNLTFLMGSILKMPISSKKKFDVIVCFEAIEHISDHETLLSEVKRLLKKDGIFIVSSPNKVTYTDIPQYDNPFHEKELYFEEFEELLKKYFNHTHFLGQKIYTGSHIWNISTEKQSENLEFVLERGEKEFYFTESSQKAPLYFVAIASDTDFHDAASKTSSWLLDGSDVLWKEANKQIAELDAITQAKDSQISELSSTVQAKDSQISELLDDLQGKNTQIVELKGINKSLKNRQEALEFQIAEMQRSIVWQLGAKYYGIIDKLLPPTSKRRYYHDLPLRGIRSILNEGRGVFIPKLKSWFRVERKMRKVTGDDKYQAEDVEEEEEEEEYEDERIIDNICTTIKPVAFYLPQFHAIPENDKWWGKGFTEWTNVKKASPLYGGHYQPRRPHEDIGYYDLADWRVMKKQSELARRHGIHGFCFYHYWFDGKRLLETPVDQFLEHPEIDINFCLCWANENWTRKWNGYDSDVLIGQKHGAQDDIDFIKDISIYFKDPRYIRINGKPMVLIYRRDLFPNIRKTTSRWREWCMTNGIGELYLVASQAFGNSGDPRKYGFDAAYEFPPNHDEVIKTNITNSLAVEFRGKCTVYSYNRYVDSLIKSDTWPAFRNYEFYRCAMLAWDNTPRKGKNDSHIFYNFSFRKYKEWLKECFELSLEQLPDDRRFVFINAWNEWAEGVYLEPDEKYGYKAINVTGDVLCETEISRKIQN
jgi:2-polyprenyl-3-methyl-5-hydroxy-6-metoxy-1,4-benzoquinol methylase